jgi:recombination associated protein RdgC
MAMDLVDLMTEKAFLGQEFLTWLWFKSEERGGAIRLESSGADIEVIFEKHILLESGEGDSYEKLICQGLQAELREARTGLAMGKKIEQARIMLVLDQYEFRLTLKGSLFEFRSVRLPKTMDGSEESDEAGAVEAKLLDRVGLYEMLLRTTDELFRMFLTKRTGAEWPQELARLTAWIKAAN